MMEFLDGGKTSILILSSSCDSLKTGIGCSSSVHEVSSYRSFNVRMLNRSLLLIAVL